MKILFNGDSVTDACRGGDPDFQLGYGYPLFVKAMLDEQYPDTDFQIINRGISGDTIGGLASRWDTDTLAEEPDILSILIGINDTGYNDGKETFGTLAEAARFEKIYRNLIERAKAKRITEIVLMEPFVLSSDTDRRHWRKDLNLKINIIKKLAEEYGTELVCLDSYLNQCVENGTWSKYTRDGVHPTPLGNKKIAELWVTVARNTIEKLI